MSSIYLDPATLSFYISFLGILGMFVFKIAEIRSGKKTLISMLANKTDHMVGDSYQFLRRGFLHINKTNAIALIQWIAYHILSWMREVYIWTHRKARAHPPSKRVIDMVRGRGEVKRNGGVSFFLKSISSKEMDDPIVMVKK
jgi:hypothetical protein